jgi:hypothetical protein
MDPLLFLTATPTSSANAPTLLFTFTFEYLYLGIGTGFIGGFPSIVRNRGSMHRMNKAQLSESPCLTLVRMSIIADLYLLTKIFALISL